MQLQSNSESFTFIYNPVLALLGSGILASITSSIQVLSWLLENGG